jgi:predicted secreted protein
MNVLMILAIYAIVWSLLLFMLLPVGVKPPEDPIPGQALSAPDKPMIKKKITWTTVLAVPVTAAIVWYTGI